MEGNLQLTHALHFAVSYFGLLLCEVGYWLKDVSRIFERDDEENSNSFWLTKQHLSKKIKFGNTLMQFKKKKKDKLRNNYRKQLNTCVVYFLAWLFANRITKYFDGQKFVCWQLCELHVKKLHTSNREVAPISKLRRMFLTKFHGWTKWSAHVRVIAMTVGQFSQFHRRRHEHRDLTIENHENTWRDRCRYQCDKFQRRHKRIPYRYKKNLIKLPCDSPWL